MKALNRLFVYLIITALAICAVAQQPAPENLPSTERLHNHIEYLASDKLQGRRTGSAGADLAAEYIAREFSRYGLRRSNGRDLPGMSILEADSPHRYLQEFPYVVGVGLGKDNFLTSSSLDSAALRTGGDWMPLGLSSNGKINAPAVFVGYGISVAELNYNDYAGIDTVNKIAVALAGSPDGDNPHGQFARFEDVRWKAVAARNAGAKALLIISREELFQGDRLSHLSYDNSAGDAGLLLAAISGTALSRLMPDANLNELEAAAHAKTQASVNRKAAEVSLSIQLLKHEVHAANVIGILDGVDPVLKNEAIVIGAHYDHLGLGGDGSLAPREGEIHHGADDNASGTAGVLELARVFAAQRPRLRRTLIFIAFSGEEEGLLGSNYYVNHPIVPLANTIAMINMDMIGRMKNKNLIIGGVGTSSEWRSTIDAANVLQSLTVTATGPAILAAGAPTGLPMVIAANGRTIVTTDTTKLFQLTLNEDGFGPSDHSSFYAKQVPVLFFWTGNHEDYHKPSDTADKINYEDESRILGLVAQLTRDLDAAQKRPTYTVAKSSSTGRATGFRVYLGTIPNYSDSNDGLLLDGVRDDSPAAKAGLKAGDRIVKLSGREIRNVYDYTYALGEMKAGQEYEVEVMRGSDRITLKLIPLARK